MTFLEKFEEIKSMIGTPDVSKLKDNFAIQVNMTDADCGGAFYIAFFDGKLAVEPYDFHDHTAMITASAGDIVDVLRGKLDPVKAVLGGSIGVEGDLAHIKALATLKKPARKPAAKKTAKPAAKAAKTADKAETTVIKAEKPAEEKAEKPAAKRTAKKNAEAK